MHLKTGSNACLRSGAASSSTPARACPSSSGFRNTFANIVTLTQGVPTFFIPNVAAWLGQYAPLGVERAAYYTTAPLHQTLSELVDVDHINEGDVRLTLGAVNVNNGEMRYFDSRDEPISIDHVMAWVHYRRHFRPFVSRVSLTGTAASIRTRRSRPCSTTGRVIPDLRRANVEPRGVLIRKRWGRWRLGRKTYSMRAAPAATSRGRSRFIICAMSSGSLRHIPKEGVARAR